MYMSTILRASFATIFLSTVLAQTPTVTLKPYASGTGQVTAQDFNFGSCASPEITYSSATGMFSALHPSSFPVGNNSDITPLMQFIVHTLSSTCGANRYTLIAAGNGEQLVGFVTQPADKASAWNAACCGT
jgi:hypothetical protein